jgi:hypothetical protein
MQMDLWASVSSWIIAAAPSPDQHHPPLLAPLRQTATPSLGDARDDWKIVRALSEVLGAGLPYNSLDDVRRRLADVAPHFGRRDALEAPLWLNGEYFKVGAVGGWVGMVVDLASSGTVAE